jgi:hypothetical protein
VIGVPQVAFSSLREAEARSGKTMATTVESRAMPEGQMASLEPMGRLDIKPTNNGDARQPQTMPEGEKQLIAESIAAPRHDHAGSTKTSDARTAKPKTAPVSSSRTRFYMLSVSFGCAAEPSGSATIVDLESAWS